MAIEANTEIGRLNFTPTDTNIVEYRLLVQQGFSTSGGTDGVVGIGFAAGSERIIPASTLLANADGTVTIPVYFKDVISFVASPEMLARSAEIILYSVDANGNFSGRSVNVSSLSTLVGGGIDEGGEGQDFDLDA
jgi:hypothetical protein